MVDINILNSVDLNQWLLDKGFSQQTVFNWFGFNSGGIVMPEFFKYKIIGDSHVGAFTADTYDLFLAALYNKLRYGLVFSDLRNTFFGILVTRFFVLSIRYGIVPSFKIIIINAFAGFMWYKHTYTTFQMHGFMVAHLPVFASLMSGYDKMAAMKALRKEIEGSVDFKETFALLWFHNTRGDYYLSKTTGESFIFRGYTVPSEIRYRAMGGEFHRMIFHIDPMALMVKTYSLNGFPFSKLLIKTYFLFSRYLNKKVIAEIFPHLWQNIGNGMIYTICVRLGKRYTPYFIRWYWTAVYVVGALEYYFVKFLRRFLVYLIFVIEPKYEDSYFSRHPGAKKLPDTILNDLKHPYAIEFLFYHLALEFLICALFLFHLTITLHAFSGQYIYIPFMTENIELNIGLRPKNSIYSGGSTAWQDVSPNKIQYWFGWFGRGTDKPSIFVLLILLLKWIIVKILEILRLKNVFLRFFKFLRNKFKNQK